MMDLYTHNEAASLIPPIDVIRHGEALVLLGLKDRLHRQLIAAQLRWDGCNVLEASDGIELLEHIADSLLREHRPRRPDLIIAEVNLSGRRGIDMLADLRLEGWDTPFVLTATDQDHALADEAMRLGPVFVFGVPFDVDDLRTAVVLLLSRAGKHFDPPWRRRRPLAAKSEQ